jgi:nucleoside-diphosphate-sugar epimerase
MNVLIIGGTGIISSEVVKRCLERKMNVTVMNRGKHNDDLPKGVNVLVSDINDSKRTQKLLLDKSFDAVVQFVAYNKEQVERDIKIFKHITKQYIFISSASAYQKPVEDYPITEETPLVNPYWTYSQNKIACEAYLNTVKDLPITIVRPSHTYNKKNIMAVMKKEGFPYAHLKRLIEGKPIIIPGDGTSVWTITHAKDVSYSFVDLIGNEKAYSETYHITGDKLYTWEQLTIILGDVLGVKPNFVHIPTDLIIKYLPEMEGPLLGDKAWSAIFDNSKIKALSSGYRSTIGYEEVAKDVVSYYKNDESLQKIDLEYENAYDKLIEDYTKLLKH